ncbi:MAG: hypothetical protein ACE5G8_04015, partial [Anaerolineae bacterium]
LPMLAVRTPVTTSVPPEGVSLASGTAVTPLTIPLPLGGYVTHTVIHTDGVTVLGTYYTLAGENEVHVAGARPILPRTSRNIHQPDTIAHGVLMIGGTFTDVLNIDPAVSRVLTDDVYSKPEPVYFDRGWYPSQLAAINRFLTADGQSRERLVVVPGQFRANSNGQGRTGTQRLYTNLQFEVYHAPFTVTDFTPPGIWQVEVISGTGGITFRALVDDDEDVPAGLKRVVALYHEAGKYSWRLEELHYNASSGYFEGTTGPTSEPIRYFFQAVDSAGNVALALEHGAPFDKVKVLNSVYLPLVIKN